MYLVVSLLVTAYHLPLGWGFAIFCWIIILFYSYSKTATLKKNKKCFSRPIIAESRSKVLQNAPSGAFCKILLIFIKLPFVMKIFILSNFEWPFYTCFSVYGNLCMS